MYLQERTTIVRHDPKPGTNTATTERLVRVTLDRMDGVGMRATESLPSDPSADPDWTHHSKCGSVQRDGSTSKDFYHVSHVNEIFAMMEQGDPRTTEQVEKLVKKLEDPSPVDLRRKIVYREDGDELDETRWLDLDYDHMFRRTERRMQRTTNKVIEIAFSWGGNCTSTNENLAATGAAAVALANRLENLGYSCGIRAFGLSAPTTGSRSRPTDVQVVEVVMKRPGEPLNIEAVAAMAAHPGVFRYYGIGLTRLAHFNPGWGWGYSMNESCASEAEAVLEALVEKRLIDPYSVMLPRINSFAAAQTAVQEVLHNMTEIETEFLMDRR